MEVCAICENEILENHQWINSKRKKFICFLDQDEPTVKVHLICRNLNNRKWK